MANASARAIRESSEIAEELSVQIARPVRWHESVARMAEAGVTSFVEFGPGRVLTGLAKRLVPGATLVNISTWQEAQPKASLAGSA
jgi:[acyl-carrier-protein] S-malonyltransferase